MSTRLEDKTSHMALPAAATVGMDAVGTANVLAAALQTEGTSSLVRLPEGGIAGSVSFRRWVRSRYHRGRS